MDPFAARIVPEGGVDGWLPTQGLWNALEPDQRRVWAYEEAKRRHPLWVGPLDVTEEARAASTASRWLVKCTDYGNGHREALVMRRAPDPFRAVDRWLDLGAVDRPPRGEAEDREGNIERAVRRAKSQVRQVCKTLAVNSLWSLTYRECVTDRELVLRHLDRFRRAVAAVLPGWRYVAVLERQERGAWHVHLATHALPTYFGRGGVRLKSWDVMRGIWRGITRDLGGNFDESKRRTRWGGVRRRSFKGAGSIATYLAGYVAKDMHESPLNRKRYSRSTGVEVPRAERLEYEAGRSMAELVELCYAAVGDRVSNAWYDPGREVFFIATDDTSPG